MSGPTNFPKKDLENYEEISNPFEEEDETIIVDMTEHANIEDKAVRVELRRTRDPATSTKRAPALLRIIDPSSLVGLLNPHDLPEEGKHFNLPYHSCNSLSIFGVLLSQEPIQNLTREEDCFFFETSEGQWRLKILDAGN